MYTDKNGIHHHNLDDKPWWWYNLEKAWKTNKKNPDSKNRFDTLVHKFGVPRGVKYHSDQYVQWSLQQDWGEPKRKVGRPKLKPEQRKKKQKLKRSDEMRQLLKDNGIEVIDGFLEGYPSIAFMPNGRLKIYGYSITVHQFLENIDDY